MVSQTSAKIIAHRNAKDKIPNIDIDVDHGDIIKVGKTVDLECLDTPGHTMSHISLLSRSETPALFSGDALFNAGAGNCHFGGDPHALFKTFSMQFTNTSTTMTASADIIIDTSTSMRIKHVNNDVILIDEATGLKLNDNKITLVPSTTINIRNKDDSSSNSRN